MILYNPICDLGQVSQATVESDFFHIKAALFMRQTTLDMSREAESGSYLCYLLPYVFQLVWHQKLATALGYTVFDY